jgi:monoamine oxidase
MGLTTFIGSSAIAEGLAAGLTPGSILLESPAKEISQFPDFVLIKTSNGKVIQARKVIMANPINTYDYIRFTPPLPRGKATITSKALPSIYAKVLLSYASPWLREIGLSGKFLSMTGPICFSWDTCDLDTQQYSLAVFVAGPIATEWHQLPVIQREQSIVSHLARLVGPDHGHLAHEVLEVNAMEWTKEEFVGGAPGCSMPPGVWADHAQDWREPFRHIHFAGNETAFEFKGYLEGAVQAGSRAADEVKAALLL